MRLLILIVLLLTSCKKENSDSNSPAGTPSGGTTPLSTSFTPYLNRFLSLASQRSITLNTSQLTIQYDPSLSGSNILGSCAVYTSPTRKVISINQTYWQSWANQRRSYEMEQLMFHELGHCLLTRSHDSTTKNTTDNNTAIPASIMNPFHVSGNYYKYNYNYYIDELFNSSIIATVNLYANNSDQYPTNVYASKISQATSNVEIPYQDGIEFFECDDN